MGRDKEYPLTPELQDNLSKLLIALNKLREAYGQPMLVTSGYRPGHYNKDAGGAPSSAHLTCEACDFSDTYGHLARWCKNNQGRLRSWGLYIEDPRYTVGWLHAQVKEPGTKNVFFIP